MRLVGAVALLACVCAVHGAASAVAVIASIPGDTNNWQGTVTFVDLGGMVNVSGTFTTTAANGLYGIHVHTYGDTSNPNNVGAHFSSAGSIHGCPPNETRHIGDLGNLNVMDGVGTYGPVVLDLLALTGDASIIGRAVVVHTNEDTCSPSWMGTKAAMGPIGIQSVAGNTATVAPSLVPTAIAVINPTTPRPYPAATGLVTFYPTQGNRTRLSMSLTGLLPNQACSFHIHQYGDMTGTAGASAGTHYNPYTSNHGWPTEEHHAGDLGNFTADATGAAFVNIDVDLPVLTGPYSVVGRMLVIHNQTDQGSVAQTTGNAGARIGWGIIALSSSAINTNAYPVEVATVYVSNTPSSALAGMNYTGSVTFTRVNTLVSITGTLRGFAPNSVHGVHVHQYGDLSGDLTTGSHWNPFNAPHSCPGSGLPRHMGDMGNWTADANGVITISMMNDIMDLAGLTSIVGRALVVHQNPDDCTTQPTGNAAGRLAAGVIGVANVVGNAAYATPALGGLGPTYYGLVGRAVLSSLSGANGAVINASAFIVYDDTNLNLTYTYLLMNVSGLAPNTIHGVHIHTYGDVTDRSGMTASGHFNPYGLAHQLPYDTPPRHQGDWGNLKSNPRGEVIDVLFGPFDTGHLFWDNNIIGRTLMIHALEDIGAANQPTGGAGGRIAAGVIGIGAALTHNIEPYPTSSSSFSSYSGGYMTTTTGTMGQTSTSTTHATEDTIASSIMGGSFTGMHDETTNGASPTGTDAIQAPPPGALNTGAIVAVSIGSIAVLAIIIGLTIFVARKRGFLRRQSKFGELDSPAPAPASPTA